MYDQRELEMFHIVYKITNTINNKTYIGKHSTKDLDDGYLGSGVYLQRAISKYGKENFTKEILFTFNTEQEAFEKEKELVTEDVSTCPNSYNVKKGGYGGFDFIVKNSGTPYEPGKKYRYKSIKKGTKHNAGTVAVVRDNINLRIPQEEFNKGRDVGQTTGKSFAINISTNLTEYVDNTDPRWKTGELKGNQKGKSWYNDGKRNYFRFPDNVSGLIPGRINMKTVKGKRWYHNDKHSFHLFPSDQKITELNLKLGRVIR